MPTRSNHRAEVLSTTVVLPAAALKSRKRRRAESVAVQQTSLESLLTDRRATLKAQVHARLLALNFHAFARCVALVMERSGFGDVRLAGRHDWKGRRKDGNGGFDLVAELPGAFSPRPVLVQVKQYDRDQMIYQRTLDELIGVALRNGASEALLVTTGQFSPSIVRSAYGGSVIPSIVPLRLMDGDQLLEQCLRQMVGVRLKDGTAPWDPDALEIDADFFEHLARAYSGNGRAECRAGGEQQFLVTLAVEPLSPKRTEHPGSGV